MATINPTTSATTIGPKIIDIEQRSDAWYDFRRTHIGGSDSPIIMRTSFWDTPFSLYLLKTGQKVNKKDNRATDHGHANEGFARQWYQEETGNFVNPAVLEMT